MTAPATTHTRLVVVGSQSRLDIAAPHGHTLTAALQSVGITLDPHRHVLVGANGQQLPGDSPVESLRDGTLLTIVDPGAPAPEVDSAARSERDLDPSRSRADVSAPWWALTTITGVLLVASLIDLGGGSSQLSTELRLGFAIAIAIGALATGLGWAQWARAGKEPVAIVVPLLLAFTAGTVGTPALYKGVHLALSMGFLSTGVLGALLAVTGRERTMRAIAGAITSWSLTFAVIWGVTLLLDWNMRAAAALTLGLVAAGLRYIPTTLLRLPDGYAIEYRHFLSNRWSVRGAIPDDPGPITMDVVRPYVDESVARLTVGVVTLSLSAALMTHWVTSGVRAESVFERIGSIVLLITTVLAMLLWSRRTTAPALRWPPRLAAAAMVIIIVINLAMAADAPDQTAIAATLLGISLVATLVLVPASRNRVPLGWSRAGDIFETMCVVLAPPAAMFAAGTLDFVRTLVAG